MTGDTNKWGTLYYTCSWCLRQQKIAACVCLCVCEGEREGDTNRVIYLVMAAVLAVNGSSQPSDLQGTAQCKKHYASYVLNSILSYCCHGFCFTLFSYSALISYNSKSLRIYLLLGVCVCLEWTNTNTKDSRNVEGSFKVTHLSSF